MSACAVLLMSSDVQAKCTNSAADCNSARSRVASLSQYSTAFTSWLVRASIALMFSKSASEKSCTSARSRSRATSGSGGICGKPSIDRRISHSISTRRRARMNANSENTSRSASVCLL
jgi:hypothetical protein